MPDIVLKAQDSDEDFDNDDEFDSDGFHLVNGWFYIYPIDMPCRKYQYKIVQECLFKNVLVCLPTGLGKTFVAAVVMMNFYRWFPEKKIVFIAPTRPLVCQQYSACMSIGGIRAHDVTCITGATKSTQRVSTYRDHKIFFLTPQVLQNDISSGLCQPQDIKCLVIDEAHKATKNHAFCQVVRSIKNLISNFRVLALTASPGENLDNIVDILSISSIEYYHEDHEDVKEYVQDKKITEIVLNFEGETKILVLQGLLDSLAKSGAISKSPLTSWSSYRFMMTINQLSSKKDRFPPSSLYMTHYLLIAYERLMFHGLLAFTRSLFGEGSSNFTKNAALNYLKRDIDFFNKLIELSENVESRLKNNLPPNYEYHPKITCLINVLIQHFSSAQDNSGRVIVFSQFRDSVDEIVSTLNRHSEIMKVMPFIGQADTKNSKGLRQKEQLEALERFRNGDFNVLVSTSVGEEGLDIGEVKLIVFYDVSASPLRLIQRMGRTGRKESGRIVLIMMKGVENGTYMRAKGKSKAMNNTLTNKLSKVNFVESCRLVPSHIIPYCVKSKIAFTFGNEKATVIDQPVEKDQIKLNPRLLVPFEKPMFDISTFHVQGTPGIFRSVKSQALHSIITRRPAFKKYNPIISTPITVTSPVKTHQNFKPQLIDDLLTSDSDFETILNEINVKNTSIKTAELSPSHKELDDSLPSIFEVELSQNSLNKTDESVIARVPKRARKASKASLESNKGDSIQHLVICKTKKKKLGREMLLTQAEVVDEASSDTQITDDNNYVYDSFINDESLAEPEPQHSFYRRILSSPTSRIPTKTNTKYNRWQNIVDTIEQKINEGVYTDDEILTTESEIISQHSDDTKESPIIQHNLIDPDMFCAPVEDTEIESTIYEASKEQEKFVIFIDSRAMLHSQVI
ncbi:ATP-dependent DNA helicase MPH1 [Thelohanellus kitauei]|uniref:ATP-dependent DNA helicase MPH1 n=1 Tax=Thelohanellus kitauei TaxID=669202 RepID=A0A0C2NBR8_THEKT|nr:ATP-dependent DNA helicase MPH1 [Thelohanellus kitauei]